MKCAIPAVLLLATGALGAPIPKELKHSDKLDGVWEIIGMEAAGAPRPALKQRWRIEGGTITVEQIVPNAAPRLRPPIAIKVEASTDPKTLDYNTDRVVRRAIYELDGDTLRILMAAPRGERPKGMKADTGTTLYIFKRVKE